MNTTLKTKSYYWSGLSPQHKLITGEIEAQTLEAAKNHLNLQGIYSLQLKRKLFRMIDYGFEKVSSQDLILFFRQLGTLLAAGIPIIQSLDILRQSQEKKLFANLVLSIKNEIENGKSLAKSLQKFPTYFDAMTYHLVHIGEHTGTLDTSLKSLALYFEKNLSLQKKLIQALFYPLTISFIAIIVSVIMLIYVVPRFEEFFNTLHGELPLFTQFIIHASKAITHYGWIGIIFIFLGIIFFKNFKNHPGWKQKRDTFMLQIPVLSSFLKKIILARFNRSLAILFSVGLPLSEAIKMMASTTVNQKFAQAIFELHFHISSGQQLHKALQTNTLFPSLMIQMIKIGEESGKLHTMLTNLAEIYEADIDHFLGYLSQLLEPLIMVVLGVLIGGLVIAMYLPIFKLGTMI